MDSSVQKKDKTGSEVQNRGTVTGTETSEERFGGLKRETEGIVYIPPAGGEHGIERANKLSCFKSTRNRMNRVLGAVASMSSSPGGC